MSPIEGEKESGWPHEVDMDEQIDMTDELREMAEGYVEDGMHPEQVAHTLHLIRGSFSGKAQDETKPHQFYYRANSRLFEVLKELAENDEYDGSWQELSWILAGLEELARSQARRERESDAE